MIGPNLKECEQHSGTEKWIMSRIQLGIHICWWKLCLFNVVLKAFWWQLCKLFTPFYMTTVTSSAPLEWYLLNLFNQWPLKGTLPEIHLLSHDFYINFWAVSNSDYNDTVSGVNYGSVTCHSPKNFELSFGS